MPGSAAPAARIPTTKSMSRTPRPAPASSHRGREEDAGTFVTPGTTPPHPLPAHPARQTAPPTLPPGPPSPERRRDQLLSGTGGSFVTLLLLSHAGASPSPSSRHRVPPHIPPTAPPRRRPRGQGATSASATGRRRYRHRGGGRSAGGISGGTPRGDTWGDTATHGDALRRPRGCRWRSRFSKAFPVGNAKDGRTDGGTERGFHAYQRSR